MNNWFKNINKKQFAVMVGILIIGIFLAVYYFAFYRNEAVVTVTEKEHQHTLIYNKKLSEEKGKTIYTCPMHPQVISDRPGTCPICGMDLVKKVQASEVKTVTPANVGEVALSPSQQVLANVAVTTVKRKIINKKITAVGRITFDETRQQGVSSWVDGRINRLYVNFTGDVINKGQVMLDIYSPDLVATQQEYLTAYDTYQNLKNSRFEDISDSSASILEASRRKLLLWGIKEGQINELVRTRAIKTSIPIYAPASGIVVKKNVVEGQYVKTGDILFDVANLSTVWAEADIFEYELGNITTGQTVRVRSEAYPERLFAGQVAFVYPFLEGESRTIKVRAAIANPGYMLKPGMVVNAELESNLGNPLVIPRTAVQITGKRNIVFVEKKKGVFVPREIEIGESSDDYYSVISGLKAGERIATSGGFLIDSESQINTMPGMPGMDMGNEKQNTGNQDDMDMSGMEMESTGKKPGPTQEQEKKKPKTGDMDMSGMTMDN